MCLKCNDKGRIALMVWSGAYMFKQCDCEIAKENESIAIEKLQNMHQRVLENLKKVTA